MHILKRFSLWVLGVIFSLLILSVAVLAATNAVLGTPVNLKQSLAESNVYDGVADGLADQAVESTQRPQKQDGGRQEEGISLDEKTTREIASRVITPQRVQSYAEQIIDGTYNWLEGEANQPDFKIDLAGVQKDLGNAVGDAAVKRMKKLPECTFAQLQQLDPNEINPFDLPCRPPGINIQAERAKLVKEITKNEGLLGEETTFTADEIGKDEETGKNAFENLAAIPVIFQWSKVWPWILGVFAIAIAAVIVYWNEDRYKGTRKVAFKLLISGILLLVGIGLATFAFNAIDPSSKADATQLETAVYDALKSLNAYFNRVLLYFASAYVILGSAGLVYLRKYAPKTTSNSKPNQTPKK